MGEVGHAATRQRLSLEEANRMVLELVKRYEHVFTQPGGNPGVRFDQSYDLKALKPVPAWEAMYREVKAELCGLGLAL